MERERARNHFAVPEELRRQSRFEFSAYRAPAVREALFRLFHGKCAFCESPADDIMHFRPEGGVVHSDGTFLPDHYWWLSGEWDNLYPSCAFCNRHLASGRGGRFPLETESSRAPVEASAEQLAEELPLLLDPCRDRPEDHLLFEVTGEVAGLTLRGQTTITLAGLNRPELVEKRRRLAAGLTRLLHAVWDNLEGPAADDVAGPLRELLRAVREEQPYVALARQIVGEFHDILPPHLRALFDGTGTPPLPDRETPPVPHDEFLADQEDFSLARPGDAETYRAFRRYVEHVSIRNVKAIRELDLDLTRSAARTAPWTVLLGENAAGKSTVLQAITLALIGRDGVERLGLDARVFIRRSQGVSSGSVSVRLSGSTRERTLRFTHHGFEYENAEEPQTLVLAYGETRLLPAPDLPSAAGQEWGRVEGLFRPARALIDAEQWLIDAEPPTFDYVAGAIRDLLGLPAGQWLHRNRTSVWVTEKGRRIPLGELSTGWQSVLATVIDILEMVTRLWPKPDLAEGIVLLDELGAHLHPRWRLRLVTGLREMLPGMQFIASTHEPLCLRGVKEHETVLMRRDAQGLAFATTDLPAPTDMRVDQLLTSRFFGLGSTLDPDLDAKFDEYYELLAIPETSLTPEQQDTRERLAFELQTQGVLGHSRRDQLVYEAIDSFLAGERATGREDPELKESTLRRARQLWTLARQDEDVRE
ncbi:AAA family ATPase [Actinoplanes subglobosus]|uniref:AAA family ATPase n=1 Tax=Actinoplanes subglobosus TaxID=1547892 RepID=A0ABV8JDR1_9ACTN